MPQNKNKHVIFVEKDNRPSRFLLDLHSLAIEKEGGADKYKKNNQSLEDVSAQKVELGDKNKTNSVKKNEAEEAGQKKIFNSARRQARQLTFFPLLFLGYKLIRVILKICYGIGWVVVFLIKLPFIVPINILKLFSKEREAESEDTEAIYSVFNNKIPQEKFSDKLKRRVRAVNWLKPFNFLLPIIVRIKPKPTSRVRAFLRTNIKFNLPIKKRLRPFHFSMPRWQPSRRPLAAAGFLALSMMVLVLPFKAFTSYKSLDDLRGVVLGISESALASIKDGARLAGDKDFYGASNNFAKASQDFSIAEKEVKEISNLLSIIAPLIPSKDVKMAAQADLVLEAGKLSAKIAEDLTLALSGFSGQGSDKNSAFFNFFEYSRTMDEDVKRLSAVVKKIDASGLPDEYQDKFKTLQGRIAVVESSASELVDLADKLYILLGFNAEKRYLLVFQNNTEMRASGGFIGSYALSDFSNGQIKNIEVPGGGSYDTEWGMVKKIIAPEALSIVNPRWYFWDANWWPDWPTTARKLEWFYEQSERRTVDGVISLTPTAFEKILSVIGPLDMQEKYGLIFTAENFWDLTQDLVERKPIYTAEAVATSTLKNEPKKIIGDLLEKIRQELPARLDQKMSFDLLQAIEEGIEEKHILLYFNDEKLEKKVAEYGADGRIKEANWDYLMVVNSNIAGGKSDKKIKEEISHTAEIQADGTVVDTVVVKRTHWAEKNEKFVGVRNNNWMRIYTPLGSELIEAGGFSRPDDIYFSKPERDWEKDLDVVNTEGLAVIHTKSGTKIYEENGKTVFANWSQVDQGSSATVYFKYKLPFKVDIKGEERVGLLDSLVNYFNPDQKELIPYALLMQKQPGSVNSVFKSQMNIADNYKIVWSYPGGGNEKNNRWHEEGALNTDKYFAILATK